MEGLARDREGSGTDNAVTRGFGGFPESATLDQIVNREKQTLFQTGLGDKRRAVSMLTSKPVVRKPIEVWLTRSGIVR